MSRASRSTRAIYFTGSGVMTPSSYTRPALTRPQLSNAAKIDEAALGIGVEKLHAYLLANA